MLKKFITVFLLFLFSQTFVLAETVIFNTNTKKYHNVRCTHAQRCTKNCIKIEKQQAKARGGVPCKVCGG